MYITEFTKLSLLTQKNVLDGWEKAMYVHESTQRSATQFESDCTHNQECASYLES